MSLVPLPGTQPPTPRPTQGRLGIAPSPPPAPRTLHPLSLFSFLGLGRVWSSFADSSALLMEGPRGQDASMASTFVA